MSAPRTTTHDVAASHEEAASDQKPPRSNPIAEWTMRRKLMVALAIPMLLASLFGALRVWDATLTQRAYADTRGQVSVLKSAVEYLYAAQEATVVARSGVSEDEEFQAALARVQETGKAFEDSLDEGSLTDSQDAAGRQILDLSEQLRNERGAYVSLASSVSQIRTLHNGVTNLLEDVINDQLSPEPMLPQVANVMDGRLSFTLQQLQTVYDGETIANPSELYAELGVEAAALDQLTRARGDEDELVRSLQNQNALRFGAARENVGDVSFADTFALYDDLSQDVFGEIDDSLAASAASARNAALVNALITLAALIFAISLALAVARMLINPVRRVRDGALAVAGEQLPSAVAKIRAGQDPGEIVPIDVTTHEEMGQLARAVDDMHRTAVRLAADEATLRSQVGQMLVTLSRRNTSLVNQQLGLIEELERDEEDPRRLESLFRLDHLAARMCRTAESLVILSDAPVRTREGQPLSVADVVHAATAGVQEYQRVEILGASPDQIVGSAANDVVHLLTEVIDNALSYSPPNAAVHVSTTSAPGQTVVSVSDGGLGIPDDAVDDINAMLQSGADMSPDAARRMGLFVVSRLARRHGVAVSLSKNGRGGITATISIPSSLLVGADRAPQPVAALRVVADDGTADTVVPSEAPAEPADRQVDQIVAAINAVTGLPQRRPGSTSSDRQAVATPAASGSLFAPGAPAPAAAPAPAPAAEQSGESADVQAEEQAEETADEVTVIALAAQAAEAAAPADETSDELIDETVTETITETIAEAADDPDTEQPADEETARGADDLSAELDAELNAELGAELDAVLDAAPSEPSAAADADVASGQPSADPLTQPWPSRSEENSVSDANDDEKGSIFAELRSSWLSSEDTGTWTSSEVDAGWHTAEQVAETHEVATTDSGLPKRRPGTRLVPGGVTPPAAPTARDPEAIRRRLAAHTAGVARGRNSAATPVNTDEEAGPA